MTIRRNTKLVPDGELSAFLRTYERATEVKDGRLSYNNLYEAIDWYGYELLPESFSVSPPIDRSRAISLFRRALKDARLAGTLTAASIQAIAEKLHHQDNAVPPSKYTLWTKFRACNMAFKPGFRLRWAGVEMRTVNKLPDWLHLEEYFFNGVGSIEPHEPVFYGHLILSCTDRHDQVAVNRMLDSLQFVMGLFNLYAIGGQTGFRIGRPAAPGALWLGPYQFPFRGRKSLADQLIWYNTDYDEGSWNDGALDMGKVLGVMPRVKRALEALENHPLRDVLVRSISLAQDGFASRESNHRLLRYWSALERLYVEEEGREGSNHKVIKRATFAENDPKLAQWTLSHIARLRNDYVHAGGGGHDLDAFGQFLKLLLCRHLHHWIHTGGSFETHHDLITYVDLPRSRRALNTMKAAIDRRIALVDQMDIRSDDASEGGH
jgi:hypothetical protein